MVKETGVRNAAYGADKFGFKKLSGVNWNLTEAPLYEHAVTNGEASIVAGGALSAFTGHHTGRSPKDKHTVVDDLTKDSVWWDGNRKLSKEHFDVLLGDFIVYFLGFFYGEKVLSVPPTPEFYTRARHDDIQS